MKRKIVNNKQRVYLDYASATPIDSEVVKTINKHVKYLANPSSLYEEGRTARMLIEKARENVAKILHAHNDEIFFTSGATESNTLAIKGCIESFLRDNPATSPHIVTTTIEHSAVLETVAALKNKDIEITIVDVDDSGVVNPRAIRDALKSNTVLVSVMYANNEIGTIQPIKEISKVIHRYKTDKKNIFSPVYPIFHTDAAQAANYLSLDSVLLGVDLMSLDGGKIYGMKGSGCLYKRRGVTISPLFLGGGQESGLRSGTENILAIVSFAKALEIAQSKRDTETKRLTKLRDYFFTMLLEIPDISINGSIDNRLPNNCSICIKGLDAEFAVYCLDEHGVACSSASTCMNNKEDSYSYVIKATRGGSCETSSLRFTLGRETTKKDIDSCSKILKKVLLQQYGSR